MKNNILIALDASDSSQNIIDRVAKLLAKDVKATLFHVLPKAPSASIRSEAFLRDHSPTFGESVGQHMEWIKQTKQAIEEIMEKAKRTLTQAGFDPERISIKIVEGKEGVARDILEEVRRGKYHTIVMGRRGLSGVQQFLMGSVSSKVIQHAKNCGVWIME